MIRVNKESIDILSQSQPQTTHAHHKHSTTLSIDDKPLRSEKNESGGLKEIIKKLNSKNTAILDELYKLQRENEELQTKVPTGSHRCSYLNRSAAECRTKRRGTCTCWSPNSRV